jgi:hypothetical protein
VVAGDRFNISGTSDRVAGTQLNLTVTATNIEVNNWTAVGLQVSKSGTYSAEFFATRTLLEGGINLANGDYVIKINDTQGLLETGTSSFTVVSQPSVTIVSPTDGSTKVNGTNVSISGTSNRGLGTLISFIITGTNYALSGATVNATADANGNFTYYWNTTRDQNGNTPALGTYSVTAQSGTAANTISIILAQPSLAVTASPTTVTVGNPTSVIFTVKSSDVAVSGATVTLSGAGATGTGTTGADGTATISVTATSAGTITATATKTGYITGTATVTATTTATSKTGVYRPGVGFFLKSDNGDTWTPSTDLTLAWDNAATDLPIAGDWNNDGTTETGVYRPGVGFYLKMDNGNTWTPSTDLTLAWDNAATDLPIAGDWNADGYSETGVYRPGVGFYLKMDNSNTWTPSTDLTLAWDNANGDLPIAGNFV